MVMRRANFWWNLVLGISITTSGLVLLGKMLNGFSDSTTYLMLSLALVWSGLEKISSITKSLEVSESCIVYQSGVKITRVHWHEIKVYFLANDHFVAFGQQHGEILLNVSLRGDNQTAWPAKERAQIKALIERKMTEIGASEESLSSLRNNHGIKIKL